MSAQKFDLLTKPSVHKPFRSRWAYEAPHMRQAKAPAVANYEECLVCR